MTTTAHPFLHGEFAPVREELTATDLEVTGTLPIELEGRYLRNGPNPVGPVDPASHHWFLGSGMVHGIRLRDGRAEWYRNRYVQTQPHAEGLGFGEAAPGGEGNQSNVSALWHGGRLLTSGEVGFPYQLDPTASVGTTMAAREGYARKFGGWERADKIIADLTKVAAGSGLDFHLAQAQAEHGAGIRPAVAGQHPPQPSEAAAACPRIQFHAGRGNRQE